MTDRDIPPLAVNVSSGPRLDDSRSTRLLVLPWDLSSPGGVSQVVENLLDSAARAQRDRALLLVNVWGQSRPTVALESGRRTVRMTIQGPVGERRTFRHFASFLMRLPGMLWRLRRLFREESVSQVNVHYPGLDALTWVIAKPVLPGRPRLVLSFHGSDFQQARATTGFSRWLWYRLLRSADDITLCSRGLLEEMQSVFGNAANRARVVDNGVNPERIASLAAVRSEQALPGRYVVCLATFEHKKGLDVLVSAFARIAPSLPDLHLVVAGRMAEPECHRRIVEQCLATPCADRIHLFADLPHAQAMRVLAGAELLALASRREPFGIVILEAGVLGIPVVATEVCGAVQRLRDTGSIAVVPVDDPDQFAKAMSQLLNDRDRARVAGATLQAKVLQEFNWDRVAAQYDYQKAEPPHATST